MTAEEYKLLFGDDPQQDDLERVNCEVAGFIGHFQCGVCEQHKQPRFRCGCRAAFDPFAKITDEEISQMAEHERQFVFSIRAGIKAFEKAERGDDSELKKMSDQSIDRLRRLFSVEWS